MNSLLVSVCVSLYIEVRVCCRNRNEFERELDCSRQQARKLSGNAKFVLYDLAANLGQYLNTLSSLRIKLANLKLDQFPKFPIIFIQKKTFQLEFQFEMLKRFDLLARVLVSNNDFKPSQIPGHLALGNRISLLSTFFAYRLTFFSR